ncbi:solute carrier family 22 member 7-like isoform X2 [Antennarius striatus]|uniref:solute carrier family 22 member 7-like isoform X2 n=1 Tax=Antennarius striatus TaxID=241820 RepID=UPI0035AE32E6
MKFESVLAGINGFGRFQKMILTMCFIGRFSIPCHFLLTNFIADVPSHHCDFSSLDDGGVFRNLSMEEKLVVSIPVQEDGTPSSCRMFAEPQYHLLQNSSNPPDARTVPCQTGWVYDNTTLRSTVTSQWDLVCERRGENKATATIFFIGTMFGAIIFGSLSDRFGRRSMMLLSYVSTMLFGFASALSTSYVMFVVLRFFTGFSIIGIHIITGVLVVEWVDTQHRKLVGVIDSLAWSVGSAVFAGIAYLVTDWWWLTVSVTSPLIVVIITWRWLPESARWLIANGKHEQAHTYLKRCAKMNQAENFMETIKTETLSAIVMTEKRHQTYSCLDLMRTPKMRRLAIYTGLMWLCVVTSYFAISFHITGFWLDIYFTQFAYSLIEIPSKTVLYFILDKIGRRSTVVGTQLMVAICLGVNILLPKDKSLVITVIAVIGKGFSSASFATVMLYTAEVYPTVVRLVRVTTTAWVDWPSLWSRSFSCWKRCGRSYPRLCCAVRLYWGQYSPECCQKPPTSACQRP